MWERFTKDVLRKVEILAALRHICHIASRFANPLEHEIICEQPRKTNFNASILRNCVISVILIEIYWQTKEHFCLKFSIATPTPAAMFLLRKSREITPKRGEITFKLQQMIKARKFQSTRPPLSLSNAVVLSPKTPRFPCVTYFMSGPLGRWYC